MIYRRKILIFFVIFLFHIPILSIFLFFSCSKETEQSPEEHTSDIKEETCAFNWPNYRGPEMDGISKEADWYASRLDDEDALKWEKKIGYGFAGITIFGDRLFTMGLEKIKGNAKEGNDIVYCFDAETGDELWRYSYICTIGMHPGPRTAPTINENRVYTLSRDGDLYCLDYNTGEMIWYRDIVTEYNATIPEFGFSAAPVIEGDLLLINARAYGIAFNKMTGEPVWMSPEGKSAYAVIPVFLWKEKQYAAVFSDHDLVIVDVLSGEKTASFRWATYSGCNVGIPLIFDNYIFISSSYNYGCALLELKDDNSFGVVWRSKIMKHHMSAGVLIDGIYYGNDGFYNRGTGSFRAIDIMTGEEKWEKEDGVGSVTAVGNKLVFLTDKGKLTIAKVSAEAYEPLISRNLGRGIWFTPPTFCRGRFFIRSRNGKFICLDMNRKETAAKTGIE